MALGLASFHKGAFHFVAVDALRTIEYRHNRSIDMNALRAITYRGGRFSIDINALRAIAYCGDPFSIDMNALRAIAAISHREIISIE
jgi:hypothetical protein